MERGKGVERKGDDEGVEEAVRQGKALEEEKRERAKREEGRGKAVGRVAEE